MMIHRASRVYRNPRVLALIAEYGNRSARTPPAILAKLVAKAISKAHYSKEPPPFDPEVTAQSLGVAVEYADQLLTDAVLERRDDGRLVVCTNHGLSSGRRNYAICHELVHVFFSRAFHATHRRVTRQQVDAIAKSAWEEESLCEKAAAEMLMPADAFVPAARARPLTKQGLSSLAQLFDASLESTAIRYGELVDDRPYLIERWLVDEGLPVRRTLAASKPLRSFAAYPSRLGQGRSPLHISAETCATVLAGRSCEIELFVSGEFVPFTCTPLTTEGPGEDAGLVLIAGPGSSDRLDFRFAGTDSASIR